MRLRTTFQFNSFQSAKEARPPYIHKEMEEPALERELKRSVARYLEDHGHHEALRAFEKSSGAVAQQHGRDVSFARELLMDGLFDEALQFLRPVPKTRQPPGGRAWRLLRALRAALFQN